jgi:hypothetical protein
MFHMCHAGDRPIDAHGRAIDWSDGWLGMSQIHARENNMAAGPVTTNRVRVSNPSSSDGIKDLGVSGALLGPDRLRVVSPLVSSLGLNLLS